VSDQQPSEPKPPPEETPDEPVRTWTLRVLFLALFLWGLYHTLGVFLYNHDPRKAAIVFVCTAGFVAFWAMLLLLRRPASVE